MSSVAQEGRWASAARRWGFGRSNGQTVPGDFEAADFSELQLYKSLRNYERVGNMLGIKTPFFQTIGGRSGSIVEIDGTSKLNFAWCDYLGLSQLPAMTEAAKAALDRFGPCVSASRMVSGELDMHRTLEAELADFLGVESSLLFVSGHAANVSTIGTLMEEKSLIIHDEFVHNSAVIGMRLSRAKALGFRHNDLDHLEELLRENRHKHKHVLVIVEGLYSTEGDRVDLARVVELKEQYGAWLMVDDAHGTGVLGTTGRGIAEDCDIDARRVDIWMGTLSKTLGSCGGFIAGDQKLIDILKHTAPGFVFSVCLPPAMTAAALTAVRTIKAEPQRVARLHANGALFLEEAARLGLDTGKSVGRGMLPVIAGDVIKSVKLWHKVFERGINPSLIVYPGVPMKAGRLRFFLTSEHTADEIRGALGIVAEELNSL